MNSRGWRDGSELRAHTGFTGVWFPVLTLNSSQLPVTPGDLILSFGLNRLTHTHVYPSRYMRIHIIKNRSKILKINEILNITKQVFCA